MKKRLYLLALILMPGTIIAGQIPFRDTILVPNINGLGAAAAPSWAPASTNLIDASGEKVAGIFQYHSTETIHQIGIVSGAFTTSAVADLRVETIDTLTGFPSGNLVCANSSATITFTAASTFALSTALTVDCLPTLDTNVAVVVAHVGNSLNSRVAIGCDDFGSDFGYMATSNTTAGYVRGVAMPNISFVNPSGNYYHMNYVTPYSAAISTSVTATMRFVGNSFTLPYASVVTGFMLWADIDTASKVSLYSGGTELQSVSMSSVTRSGTAGVIFFHDFPSTTSFAAEQTFRIVVSSITPGTVASAYYVFNATSTQQLNGSYDYGNRIIKTAAAGPTISSASDFTDDPRMRFTIYAVISAFGTGQKISTFIGP